MFLDIGGDVPEKASGGGSVASVISVPLFFGGHRPVSPKEFVLKKQPRTDVERLAVLACFTSLTTEECLRFKTLDLSKLNTEAAQPKLGTPPAAQTMPSSRGI